MRIRRLSILGLGLMGGSVALAARKHLTNCKLTGYDLSAAAQSSAMRRRLVDKIATDPAAAVADADLVILAAPVAASVELVQRISGNVSESTLITDVCSTKQSISAAAMRWLPDPRHFVGSHPMAGSQHKGLKHADGTIFRQSLCILTPLPGTPSSTVKAVAGFWRRLEMIPLTAAPAEHDRLVALASHLPQVMASTLMASQSPESLRIAGRGLADTTRLAASPGKLWAGILLDNGRQVTSAIETIQARLTAITDAIARGDRRAIERLFAHAAGNRRKLDRIQPSRPR